MIFKLKLNRGSRMLDQVIKTHLLLVRFVTTSALLISPALAQVSGSGPSPSSDFDIFLDLPGDEAAITGGASSLTQIGNLKSEVGGCR